MTDRFAAQCRASLASAEAMNELINAVLPARPTMSAAERERITANVREHVRVAVEQHLGERSKSAQRGILLDAYLALHDRETPLVQAIGHVRDAERFSPGSESEAECITDAARAMAHAAADRGWENDLPLAGEGAA